MRAEHFGAAVVIAQVVVEAWAKFGLFDLATARPYVDLARLVASRGYGQDVYRTLVAYDA
jgi:hypothetical protein